MAIFKPFKIASSQLDSIESKEGNLIFTTDNKRIYLDAEDNNRILVSDSYENATQQKDGLLSKEDKTKLDGVESYVDGKVADLVNGAPETLDTLKEVADAIEEHGEVIEALQEIAGQKEIKELTQDEYNALPDTKLSDNILYLIKDGVSGQDIPRDGSLTIQRNGSNIKTFTENEGTDVVINILVPTKVSELTNDSGFKTTWRGIQNNLNSDSTEESLSAAQGKILKNSIDIVTTGIVNKNNIYRGKNLTNIYTIDEICARIANGTFEDLYIGDYFDITITTEYSASEKIRCVIAGFDVFLFNGDTPLTSHHAVIIMKNCFAKAHKMNPTNTTEGGYVGSDMYKTVLPKYATAIETVLGSHFLTYRNLLTTSVNSSVSNPRAGGNSWGAGVASNWGWYDTSLCLLNEINVYGSISWSSSGYDVGIQNFQLPLFKLDPSAKMCRIGGVDNVTSTTRNWWWLRDIVSSSYFAGVGDGGVSDCIGASGSGGVRGFWLIG